MLLPFKILHDSLYFLQLLDLDMKRIIFCGTPSQSAHLADSLHSHPGLKIVAVVTNPDSKVGRKQILTPSPVKEWAMENSIDVFTPEKFDEDFYDALRSYNADFFAVMAYGKLVPQEFLDIPSYGAFNLHFSLLPAYRGATPIQSALLHGEKISGITIFKIVKAMDAGEIYIQQKTDLENKIHSQVWEEMIEQGSEGFIKLFTQFEDFVPTPQNHDHATFCSKIKKSDGEVSFTENTATEIINQYRAYERWPGIFYFDEEGKRVKILEILLEVFPDFGTAGAIKKENGKVFMQTKKGSVHVGIVQKEGKKAVEAEVFYD